MKKTLIKNIGLLASPRGNTALGGEAQGEISKITNAYVLIENGRIVATGSGTPSVSDADVIDAAGSLVTPGLVDAHTHLIFGGLHKRSLGGESGSSAF